MNALINPTQQEVAEQFKRLPSIVQDVYIGEETAISIREIGDRHKLELSHIRELADEIGLLLLGFTDSNSFITNLQERLNIDKEKAGYITNEVNEKIFSKLDSFQKSNASIEANKNQGANIKEEEFQILRDTDTGKIKKLLRENSKTVSIKNLVANLK